MDTKCWTCTWPGHSSSCRTSSPGYPSPFAGPWLQALLWNSLGNVFTSWGTDSRQKLLLVWPRVTGQRIWGFTPNADIWQPWKCIFCYLGVYDESYQFNKRSQDQKMTVLFTVWEEQKSRGEGSALPGHTCGYSCRKLPQRWLVPGSRTGCWPIFGLELRSGYFSGRPIYFTVNSISLPITRYGNCYSNM